MKFLIKGLIFSIFIFFSITTQSQLKRIDSIYLRLQDSIKNGKSDITIFKLYDYYSILLEHDKRFKDSRQNYNDILNFIDDRFKGKMNDSLKTVTFLNLSFLYYSLNNIDSTIFYTDKVIDMTNKSGLMSLHVKAYANQVNGLVNKERYTEAIQKSFSLRDKINEVNDTIAKNAMNQTNYLNLGFIFIKMRNWDEAEKYLLKSVAKKGTNVNLKARSYLNLSSVYLETNKPKLALISAKKADSLTRKGQFNPYEFANIQINIASSYNKIKDYKNGLKASNEVIKISNEVKFTEGIAQGSLIKGEALTGLNRIKEAISYLEEGYSISKELDNNELKRDASQSLAHAYAKLNKFKRAFKYKEIHQNISDSLNLVQKNKDVSNALAKYQTAEKEKQLTKQKLELQTQKAKIASQRNTQLLLVGGLGFLILGGLFFHNRNKSIQKQKLQAAVLIEKEKGLEAVIKASEEERKRISKDLHDGVGQEMAALKMAINHIKENETNPSQKQALQKIYENCSNSADEIRNISHQMMPRTLLENGLVSAIKDLMRTTFSYSNIKYDFESFNINERFNERVEISLYRVTQELITNIVKHSKATEVNAMLYKKNQDLILFVEDNGIGLSKEKANKGHGILNIKSRVDMIKGSINYQPSPNSGTTATIIIPL